MPGVNEYALGQILGPLITQAVSDAREHERATLACAFSQELRAMFGRGVFFVTNHDSHDQGRDWHVVAAQRLHPKHRGLVAICGKELSLDKHNNPEPHVEPRAERDRLSGPTNAHAGPRSFEILQVGGKVRPSPESICEDCGRRARELFGHFPLLAPERPVVPDESEPRTDCVHCGKEVENPSVRVCDPPCEEALTYWETKQPGAPGGSRSELDA